MSALPVLFDGAEVKVFEPSTGELVLPQDATDRALLEAQAWLDTERKRQSEWRAAIAAVLCTRHGFGMKHRAGFSLKVEATRSWTVGTVAVCKRLLRDGMITDAEFEDAVPYKRVPDGRKCKALLERLMTSGELESAKLLSDSCSVSKPRISGLAEEVVEAEAVDA
jgi:hypothetical protein